MRAGDGAASAEVAGGSALRARNREAVRRLAHIAMGRAKRAVGLFADDVAVGGHHHDEDQEADLNLDLGPLGSLLPRQ
jgi:hypothetical protein